MNKEHRNLALELQLGIAKMNICRFDSLKSRKSSKKIYSFMGSLLRPPGFAGQAGFSPAAGQKNGQSNLKRNFLVSYESCGERI